MRMCVRTNRMNEENREAGHSDRWSLYHWILGIYVTEALGNDEVMKKSGLGAKQAESPCHAALCSATSRCNRFNGNEALWCVEKTWQAGLEAGWSWGQDANETQEYSAGLKSRTDWYLSQKGEEKRGRIRTSNPFHECVPSSNLYEKAKKVTLYSTRLNIRFLKTRASFVLVTLTQLRKGLLIVQQLNEITEPSPEGPVISSWRKWDPPAPAAFTMEQSGAAWRLSTRRKRVQKVKHQ